MSKGRTSLSNFAFESYSLGCPSDPADSYHSQRMNKHEIKQTISLSVSQSFTATAILTLRDVQLHEEHR